MKKHSKLFVYLACAWALIFAVPSFYWAAGGTFGLSTLGEEITNLQSESWFAIFVWLTAFVKVALGIVVLMLLKIYKHTLFNKLARIAVWTAGIVCIVYGSLNLSARLIMSLGLIPTPDAMHSTAATWHLILWDPWWMLGGILLVMAVHATKNK